MQLINIKDKRSFSNLLFALLILAGITVFVNPLLAGGFALAYIVAVLFLPKWISTSIKKALVDRPDERKHHAAPVPTMGGIAIYLALVPIILLFTTGLWSHWTLLCSLGILLITGIWDDRFDMPAKIKLIFQLTAAGLSVYGAELHLAVNAMIGMDVPFWFSFTTALVVIAGMINAVNFLDGVDGLAGGIGFINAILFTCYFGLTNRPAEAVLCAGIAGAALGFLLYNFQSGQAKVFMGDTGSMLLGWFTAVCGLLVLSDGSIKGFEHFDVRPFITGVFLLPVFDAIRLIIIRTSMGISPFSADRRHLHHMLGEIFKSKAGPTPVLWLSHGLTVILATYLASLGPLPVFVPLLLFVAAIMVTEMLTFRKLLRLYKQQLVLETRIETNTEEHTLLGRRLKEFER